jgi:hypothetical protein
MALKISIIGLTESQLLICCLNKDWNMRQELKQDTHLYIRVWWWLTGDRWRGRSRPDFLHMEFLQSTEGKAKKSNMAFVVCRPLTFLILILSSDTA